eukprot:1643900-Pleurochrysis_carterae.AAC.1
MDAGRGRRGQRCHTVGMRSRQRQCRPLAPQRAASPGRAGRGRDDGVGARGPALHDGPADVDGRRTPAGAQRRTL